MSTTIQYDLYAVTDGTGTVRPYTNATVETGYFYWSDTYTSYTNYFSLKTALVSSNGLVNVGAQDGTNAGFQLNRVGTYRLYFAIDTSYTSPNLTNIQTFGLGTANLNAIVSGSTIGGTSVANLPSTSFLGTRLALSAPYKYSFALGDRNTVTPSLLAWNMDAFNKTNATVSKFGTLTNSAGQYLVYDFYSAADSTGAQTPYLCSGCLEFSVPSTSTRFYLNYACSTGFQMGKSPFVLEFVSDTIPSVPTD